MNLTSLLGRLLYRDGLLPIDLSALESPVAWAFLRPFFAGRPVFQLRDVPSYDFVDDEVIVRGVGVDGPLAGLRLIIRFRASALAPGELAIAIAATAQAPWALASAFPSIARTPFAGLRFASNSDGPAAVLTLRSETMGADPAGVSLVGRAVAASMALPAWIEAGAEAFDLEGSLSAVLVDDALFAPRGVRPDQLPIAMLGMDLRFMVPPVGTAALPLRLTKVEGGLAAILRYDTAYFAWRVDTCVTLTADLEIGASPALTIPLAAELHNATEAVFRAELGAAVKTSLRALSTLLGPFASPLDALSLDELVDLVDLEARVAWGEGGPTVEQLSARVATRDDLRWTLIPRIATLDAIDVGIRVREPFAPSRTVDMTVHGLVGVGEKGTLALSASFERDAADAAWTPTFYGALDRSRPISVTEIFAQLTGMARDDLPLLEVHTMDVVLAPATRRYQGAVELAGDWRLPGPVPLILEGVGLSFAREGETDTRLQLHAGLRMGALWISVAAAHESASEGWTFLGSAGEIAGQTASLGEALQQPDVRLPALIAGLRLEALEVTFNTKTGRFSTRGTVRFPIDGDPRSPSAASLTVDLTREPPVQPGGTPQVDVGGQLTVLGRTFAARFAQRAGADDLWVASYADGGDGRVELRSLIAEVSAETAQLVPAGFEIQLRRAQLAFVSPRDTSSGGGATSRFVFGVELGAGIRLSQLPLVGRFFDDTQTLGILLQLVVANADFSAAEVDRINALSPAAATKLRSEAIDVSASKIRLETTLELGGRKVALPTPLTLSAAALTATQLPVVVDPAKSAIQWMPVQQAFGAFHFERVGVGLTADHQSLALLLDASVELAGLTLTLAGLGAELSLVDLTQSKLSPRFHLDGVGLDFVSGDLVFAGALLGATGPNGPVYDGMVTIRHRELGIVGVGAYRELTAGEPSLFVHAQVDYPLGGPAFFFVEGLSFGFGYNRRLVLPALEALPQFPLFALAQQGAPRQSVAQLVSQLDRYLQPAEGEYFVAAGVRFSSFKIVRGQVLVTVAFGRTRELDVLGLATATVPPEAEASGAPLLLKAELGLRGRYRPEEGDISVEGLLMPDAYLFAPGCHLTGGFAFFAWTKTGDFVLTLGGYHPRYVVPAHYPKVPRLGLSWQVNENLSLKAEAYFALTSSAIMAGGRLRADWVSGDLHASFNAGIDCLVSWQPYAYDAEVDVSVAVAYRTTFHTFTADLAARLSVWGPPFSGTAHVKWWIFSFDVAFGDAERRPARTVTWPEVVAAFLPAGEVLTVGVQSGKVAQHERGAAQVPPTNARDHLGFINPRELCLTLRSAIPVTQGTVLGEALDDRSGSVGVVPMRRSSLASRLVVTLTHEGDIQSVNERLVVTAIDQPVPAALWGTAPAPALGPAQPVLARSTFAIRVRPPTIEGTPVAQSPAQSTKKARVPAPVLGSGFAAAAAGGVATARVLDSLQNSAARAARTTLLHDLLPDVPTELGGATIDTLRATPRLVRT